MAPSLHISQHAISRYVERVDRAASRLEARIVIGSLVSLGRARAVPRHWMRRDGIRAQPGLAFVYSSGRPGICLLVRDNTVLTVITRQLCASASRPDHLRLVRDGTRPIPVETEPRWRWNGTIESEEAA